LDIPAAELIADEGPAPLAPAQELQLCHPDIFWIPDFTVCAAAEDPATIASTMTAIIAVKVEQFFLAFQITSFSPGGFFRFLTRGESQARRWRLPMHQLRFNAFARLSEKT
jgi:hypothetical protein